MSIYRNSEGYADPTAGRALGKIVCEERRARRDADNSFRPLVYICSPFAGDTEANTIAARSYCAFAVERGSIPLAPHLLYPQFMNDAAPKERGLALRFGMILMDKCDEVWVFGSQMSNGMRSEYDRAMKKGYRIRYFTADCMELTREGASQLYGKEPSNDR